MITKARAPHTNYHILVLGLISISDCLINILYDRFGTTQECELPLLLDYWSIINQLCPICFSLING